MENYINRLKEARQSMNLSLEDISEKTKVHIKLLNAIEEGDFSPFEGEIYAIGALRLYAQAVGLDPQEIAEEHKKSKAEEQKSEEPKPQKKRRVYRRRAPFPFAFTTILVLLALIVLAGIWMSLSNGELLYFNGYQINDEEPEPPSEAESENDELEEEPEEEPEEEEPEEPSLEITKTDSEEEESFWQAEGAEELSLELIFTARCWIDIYADEEHYQEGTFEEGDELEITAEEEIRIRVGYPPGLQLKLNEEEVEGIEDYENPRWYNFSLLE